MTLGERQIERWARQIILPEVGGRGQARLLEATAAVVGDGPAARFAADLLARAGLRVQDGGDADVTLDFSGDPAAATARGRRARDARRPFIAVSARTDSADVTTLVGRPCVDCAPPATAAREPETPLALAVGALAAGEALRVILVPAAAGRLQTLDLRTGGLASRALDGPGCAACGATAS
jgi:hypothetical protein